MFWGSPRLCLDGLPWFRQRVRHEGEPVRGYRGHGEQHRQQPTFKRNIQQRQLPGADGT